MMLTFEAVIVVVLCGPRRVEGSCSHFPSVSQTGASFQLHLKNEGGILLQNRYVVTRGLCAITLL